VKFEEKRKGSVAGLAQRGSVRGSTQERGRGRRPLDTKGVEMMRSPAAAAKLQPRDRGVSITERREIEEAAARAAEERK